MIDMEKMAGFEVFEGLETGQLKSIMECGSTETHTEGSVVLEESGLNSDLYVLLKGRASVEIDVTSGLQVRREPIVRLKPGDVFGEIAFLKAKRRSAYVKALDDLEVFRVQGDCARNLFEKDMALAYLLTRNLALILAQRLVDANFKWRQDMGRLP